MSASQYHRQLERKRKPRIDAEKSAGRLCRKETDKRTAAVKAHRAPSKATSTITVFSKTREVERHEKVATDIGIEATQRRTRTNSYAKTEADLPAKFVKPQSLAADPARSGGRGW